MQNKEQKSFVVYTDLSHTFDKLSDAQAGYLFKQMLAIARGASVEIEDPLLDIAFEPIRQQMARDRSKWSKTVEARAKAGARGGLAKASNCYNSLAKASKSSKDKQSLANLADNDSVNENENENKNDNVINGEFEGIDLSSLPQYRITGEKKTLQELQRDARLAKQYGIDVIQ